LFCVAVLLLLDKDITTIKVKKFETRLESLPSASGVTDGISR
jgi:hypothetical protein